MDREIRKGRKIHNEEKSRKARMKEILNRFYSIVSLWSVTPDLVLKKEPLHRSSFNCLLKELPFFQIAAFKWLLDI